jgi:hypothetical protein
MWLDEAVALSPAFTPRLTGVIIADVVRLLAVRFLVFAFETRLRDSSAPILTCMKTKYQKLCTDISAEFIPLVIESFGGYGQEFGVF